MILASLAMLLSAVLFSFIIWIVYRKFQVEANPNLEKIVGLLPGLNCGACGFAGCQNLAEALLKGEDVICPVLEKSKMDEIYKILGRGEAKKEVKKAFVLCAADRDNKTFYAQYKGVKTCQAANIYSSYQACKYGCLGFGDCAKVCPVGAIEVKNGLAVIDIDKCIGCGLCVKECPRGLIELLPLRQDFLPLVACSNKDKIQDVKEVCRVGCIGCGVCLKAGPEGGFSLKDNLARVNYDKVELFSEEIWARALDKCPRHIIQIKHLKKALEV